MRLISGTTSKADKYLATMDKRTLVTLIIACVAVLFFFFQAEDGIRDYKVTGVQTCALPICRAREFIQALRRSVQPGAAAGGLHQLGLEVVGQVLPLQAVLVGIEHGAGRSQEHTSELQSPCNLVCRLLLEKKKKNNYKLRPDHRTQRQRVCT